jgi:glycosyltransferase involved in cell wall biosynthesis
LINKYKLDIKLKKIASDQQTVRVAIINHKNYARPEGSFFRVSSLISCLEKRGDQIINVYWNGQNRISNYSVDNDSIASNETPLPRSRIISIGIASPQLRLVRKLLAKLFSSNDSTTAIDMISYNTPFATFASSNYLKKCDILHVIHIWSSIFPLVWGRLNNKICILDNQNVETLLAKSMIPYARNKVIFWIWAKYVSILEKTACRLANLVLVVSEPDKIELSRITNIPLEKIRVIPVGTDIKKYKPDVELGRSIRKNLGIPEQDPVAIFVGRASYPPNRIAIDYIVNSLSKEVWKEVPKARFLILSRDLTKSYVSGRDDRIIFLDEESDLDYINAADIGLAPLAIGGGISLKIQNYAACGKAVITTNIAMKGFQIGKDSPFIIVDLPDFPKRVVELFKDRALTIKLGNELRQLSEVNFSAESSRKLFEDLYGELAKLCSIESYERTEDRH